MMGFKPHCGLDKLNVQSEFASCTGLAYDIRVESIQRMNIVRLIDFDVKLLMKPNRSILYSRIITSVIQVYIPVK